jgi:polar amino acid transport system permease protein
VPMTLFVSAFSIALAVVLAMVGALGRLSTNPVFYAPATFYVSLIRGTPLIIQVFFWYLALPQIKIPFVNISIPEFVDIGPGGVIFSAVPAGILALAVCYGAYMAETFRAGIQSIGKGQREAALALGMTRMQTMREIVLPQAVRIIIPPIGNEFIAMTKDSSLVSFMGVWELRFRADKIGRQSYRNFETLIIAALFYWVMQIVLQYLQGKIEARLAKGDR